MTRIDLFSRLPHVGALRRCAPALRWLWGLPMVYVGVALMAACCLAGWSRHGWPLLLALAFILAGVAGEARRMRG